VKRLLGRNILCCLVSILFLILLFQQPVIGDENDFVLPETGGYMAHCDPQMSDFINRSAPIEDVKIVWHHQKLYGEKAGSLGLGFSSNGEIAACTFHGVYDNLVVYDYDGNHIWKSGNLLNCFSFFSAPIIDAHNRVIACDSRKVVMVDPLDYDNDGVIVEWVTSLPKRCIAWSPVVTENGMVVLATQYGPIYVFDSKDGSLVAAKYLRANKRIGVFYNIFRFIGHFETINTPGVKGNRIYVLSHYNFNGLPFTCFNFYGRFFAIDVDPESNEVLKVAWYYDFGGLSGASPLVIDDMIFFDGDREKPKLLGVPHIFALKDLGDDYKVVWKKPSYYTIGASFARDPRGGFWVVNPFTSRLVHYSQENGNILEEINVDETVDETGRHIPSSVITICGNISNPVLVVSATDFGVLKCSSYVIAVDLANDNSLLWKVKISEGGMFKLDFPFGQYPILMKNGQPRIVFATVRGGAWAIGSE
jgi:hypothetical protein